MTGGYEKPYTPIPNDVFDATIKARLTAGELKALIVLWRLTHGFSNWRDNPTDIRMSAQRLASMANLRLETANNALWGLHEKNIVIRTRGHVKMNDLEGWNIPETGTNKYAGNRYIDIPETGIKIIPESVTKTADINKDVLNKRNKSSKESRVAKNAPPALATIIRQYFNERFEAKHGSKPAMPSKSNVLAVNTRMKQLLKENPAQYTESFFKELIDHFLSCGRPNSLSAMLHETWLTEYLSRRNTGSKQRKDINADLQSWRDQQPTGEI
ncbi:MAG TPA: replication protein [bacterium]|nr:replication protein [bacterium]